MKESNLYNLIPDGGNGCSKELLKLIETSSDINEILPPCKTLDELNKAASEFLREYPEEV